MVHQTFLHEERAADRDILRFLVQWCDHGNRVQLMLHVKNSGQMTNICPWAEAGVKEVRHIVFHWLMVNFPLFHSELSEFFAHLQFDGSNCLFPLWCWDRFVVESLAKEGSHKSRRTCWSTDVAARRFCIINQQFRQRSTCAREILLIDFWVPKLGI